MKEIKIDGVFVDPVFLVFRCIRRGLVGFRSPEGQKPPSKSKFARRYASEAERKAARKASLAAAYARYQSRHSSGK